jgi:hypothetical protein
MNVNRTSMAAMQTSEVGTSWLQSLYLQFCFMAIMQYYKILCWDGSQTYKQILYETFSYVLKTS